MSLIGWVAIVIAVFFTVMDYLIIYGTNPRFKQDRDRYIRRERPPGKERR